MDRDSINDLLDSINVQNPDADDLELDLLSEVT